MSNQLKKIKIAGFRSIEDSEIELSSLNFLTGPCGGGKSNALQFLNLVSKILQGRLQLTVSKIGGPDSILRFGREHTPSLKGELHSENEGYIFEVRPTPDNRMIFESEKLKINGETFDFGSGHFESKVASSAKSKLIENLKWVDIYHFCDTGENARVRQMQSLNDNAYLRPDAGNLVAFLYLLKERFPREFALIEKSVNITFPPFKFKGFSLGRTEFAEIEWLEEGSDTVLKAHQLSDGVLRFICLATLLLQPPEMRPPLILIDEPELGLNNLALGILAELIDSVSQCSQLIVATQSSTLLNEFSLENLILVDKLSRKNLFSRPDPDGFNEWLESYSFGELLDKNVI